MKYIIILAIIVLVGTTNTYRPGWEVVATGHPSESKTNSVASEQDYTTLYTIPANSINENTVYRVTINFQRTTGTSTVTATLYYELGGTKVFTCATADFSDGQTRSSVMQFYIHGTAAAGASVNVESGAAGTFMLNNAMNNQTAQPVALATNGALTIVVGVQYSGTGGTESCVLRSYLIERSF